MTFSIRAMILGFVFGVLTFLSALNRGSLAVVGAGDGLESHAHAGGKRLATASRAHEEEPAVEPVKWVCSGLGSG